MEIKDEKDLKEDWSEIDAAGVFKVEGGGGGSIDDGSKKEGERKEDE